MKRRVRSGCRALPWIARTFAGYGPPVIYVPGNHAFYGRHFDDEIPQARAVAAALGVILLAEGETVILDDTRFVGATLWTDWRLGRAPGFSQATALSRMNDFRYIRSGSRPRTLHPRETATAHDRHRQAIRRVLATQHAGPTVVVTHHAPSERSLSTALRMSELDAAYASDLEDLILETQPQLWLHGHSHVSSDYMLGATRVRTNPRGYLRGAGRPGRGPLRPENPAFDPALVTRSRRATARASRLEA